MPKCQLGMQKIVQGHRIASVCKQTYDAMYVGWPKLEKFFFFYTRSSMLEQHERVKSRPDERELLKSTWSIHE